MRLVSCFALASLLVAAGSAQAKHRRRHYNPASGNLVDAVLLPAAGDGYRIPPTWVVRNAAWGTPDMVNLIERVAKRVTEDLPGSTMYVGDISFQHGGPSPWHASHQKGCDADIIYFAVDDHGDPAPEPSEMHPFDRHGDATFTDANGKPETIHFDTPRNWELVKALVQDDQVHIEYLFAANRLKTLLLEYARATGEPDDVINRASAALQQPTDSLPHDDHMHVRISQCTVGGPTYAKSPEKTPDREARRSPND